MDELSPDNEYLLNLSKVMEGEQPVFVMQGHPGIEAIKKSLFVLKFCELCIQMTNHIGDKCQKCKIKNRINELPAALAGQYVCKWCGNEDVYYNGLCFVCYHDKKQNN